MRRLAEAGYVDSLAWVLMPDHLHWLFSLNEKHSLSAVIRLLKGRSAIGLNRILQRQGPIWQKSFYDHALRRDEDVRVVANTSLPILYAEGWSKMYWIILSGT